MLIKLAIVDDDVRLAKSLKSDLLEFSEIESVTTSASGFKFALELEQMPSSKRPDIIIMDISMSLANEGILATEQIKSQFPEIEIIIFTISEEDEFIFEAFKAGSMGYLLKSEPPSFILKTIIDVKNGGAQMSPSIARKAIQFLIPDAGTEKKLQDTRIEMLTPRELTILEHVAKGETYQQIADKLFISLHTVKKHMINIFQKLQVKNKIEAINHMGRRNKI